MKKIYVERLAVCQLSSDITFTIAACSGVHFFRYANLNVYSKWTYFCLFVFVMFML